jgi:CBS domain containing-hemolysin-like protein
MLAETVALAVVAGVLSVFAGVLSAAEAALSRMSRARAERLVAESRRGAARLARVADDAPRYLNPLLLLRVSAELFAAACVATICVHLLGPDWAAILVAGSAMTIDVYAVVGVVGRTLGRQHTERVALAVAPVAVVLNGLLGPVPTLLIAFGNALTPGKGLRRGPYTSEAELRDLVDLAEEGQIIERGEREMIHSVFELGDTLAREVMVPRTDIVFIERGKTVRQGFNLALRSGFSRIPVTGQSEDDVVGVAYLRDLARRAHDEEGRKQPVEEVARPATYVPESKPVDELLREMQAARTHLAVVIDEYGGTAGLVTIEDILEEIVGEITDEHDRETPPVEQVDVDTTRVSARLPVDELGALYGVELDLDGVESVGGLLAATLGRVPIPGATAAVAGLSLTAEASGGRRNRIGTVLVRRSGTDSPDREGEERSDDDH